MNVIPQPSIPAGENPLRHFFTPMGTSVGSNVMILHESFPSTVAKYIKVVDITSGEVLLIELAPTAADKDKSISE